MNPSTPSTTLVSSHPAAVGVLVFFKDAAARTRFITLFSSAWTSIRRTHRKTRDVRSLYVAGVLTYRFFKKIFLLMIRMLDIRYIRFCNACNVVTHIPRRTYRRHSNYVTPANTYKRYGEPCFIFPRTKVIQRRFEQYTLSCRTRRAPDVFNRRTRGSRIEFQWRNAGHSNRCSTPMNVVRYRCFVFLFNCI